MSRECSGGIATRLRAGRQVRRGVIPSRERTVYLLPYVHTDPGAHQVYCTIGTGGCFPWDKTTGNKADHSPPRLWTVDLYIHFFIHLHGVVLNWLRPGINNLHLSIARSDSQYIQGLLYNPKVYHCANIHFNIILQTMSRSPKAYLPFRLPNQQLLCIHNLFNAYWSFLVALKAFSAGCRLCTQCYQAS